MLQATNRLAEAEPLMRRALDILENPNGNPSPNYASALNNLAGLLHHTNRLAEAELLMRRELAIAEQAYGAEHPDVATKLNDLAQLFRATNRLAEAEPLMRRAIAIDEQAYGAEHPDVATNLDSLAQLLQATNRLAEAEPLMRRALAIDEQAYGAEHPNVARDLNNLAALLQATNRLPEAELLMRRALAIDLQSYGGVEHLHVATGLNNLAALLQDTNRLAEAETLMRRALAIDELSYGAEHPRVAIHLNNLADLLRVTDRLAAAEPLMHRCVTILRQFERKTGHEHPHMWADIANYVVVLQAMGVAADDIAQRLENAAATAGSLTPITPEVERLLGPAQPVADVLAALDRRYKADGRPAVYFLPPDQPMAPHLAKLLRHTPDTLNAVGVRHSERGAYAQAIVHYEESLKLQGDNPDQAVTTFAIRMNRASALRELGEVEQAREELRILVGRNDGGMIPAVAKGLVPQPGIGSLPESILA